MIALAVLGAGACVALGIGAAERLNRRDRMLQAWEKALFRMDAAVNHSGAELKEVLRRGAEEENAVLSELLRRMEATPAASTDTLLAALPWDGLLLSAERDTLQNCLASLFSPSLQAQAQALSYALAQWAVYRSACRETREKNIRLYTSLGWLGGAAVFILFC